MIGSTAVEASMSVGLSYNFTITNTQTYTNQYNDHFQSQNIQNQKIEVVGFNQTHLNYTSILTQNVYSYATLQNGQWSQTDTNSRIQSYTINTVNLTDQMNTFFMTFDFYDNPTWNPNWNASYLNQYYPGINYQNRFYYFDQKNESNPDNVQINFNVPNMISSSDVQGVIPFMKQRIMDELSGTVTSFKTLYFNASSYSNYLDTSTLNNNWYTWSSAHLGLNVAYSYSLINATQGVVQLTPQWIGRYNNLGAIAVYNQTTGSYQPRMPVLTMNNVPITYNGYQFQLSSSNYYGSTLQNPSLVSISSMNQKQPNYSKYAQVTTNGLSLQIHISTLYEEPPSNTNYYYYGSIYSHFNNPNKQITGQFTFNFNIQYDANGFLIKEDSNRVFNDGSYGTYSISMQLAQTSSSTSNLISPGLVLEIAAIPVSLGTGVGLAFLLKRKK